jgi:uncharacterized protein YkwD
VRIAQNLQRIGYKTFYDLACTRAKEIVNTWSHTRPDGSLVTDVDGINGENLSRYCNTASGTIESLMNSPTHRDNILKASYTNGVIACYVFNGKCYWVNLFGMN